MVCIPLIAALSLAAEPFPFAEAETELSAEIRVEELRAHVHRLASREFLGRRGAGAARASQHIAAALQKLQLKPAFGDSFFQPIPWLVEDANDNRPSFVGRNVGAILPGSDPALADEWILLTAHFDHLGQAGDDFYPGADDNATGVAMLLEVAEQFVLGNVRPRRTVVFVAFDLEEQGLQGSMHFATHPPRDFKKLKVFMTADMLGRSMASVMDEYLFALGSESAVRLRQLVEDVPPPDGLKIGRLGADLVGTRSDYGAFRDRRVPFLFFSTGQHPDYHRVTDTPDKIDYDKLQRSCQWIAALTARLASDDDAPEWLPDGLPPDLEEARTVLLLVTRVLARPALCPLSEAQRTTVQSVQDRLAAILDRGRVTLSERTWLVWMARLLLVTVF